MTKAEEIQLLKEQKELLLSVINQLKEQYLYTYDCDYDMDDNPVDNFTGIDIEWLYEEELSKFYQIEEKLGKRK